MNSMKTDKLSPEEINALFAQRRKTENTVDERTLSKVENEALTELLHVSLGSSSGVLSSLFSEQVSVMAPALSIKPHDELLSKAEPPYVVVLGEFTGDINGTQILALVEDDVETLTELMGVESTEENHMRIQFQVVEEVIQKMFTSVAQSMTTVLDQEVDHSLSGMDVIDKKQDFPVEKFSQEKWFVEADIQVKIGNEKNISLHLCIPVRLAKQMVGILTDSLDEEYPEETQDMHFQSNDQAAPATKTKVDDSESTHNIQSVQFSNFDESSSTHSEPNNLDMLLDIPLQVTVELGRTKRMVKEILNVSQGSIIELDKLAGEPVDILINNKLIAVGEVVVIDENFGVRVTDILSTADRISKLR